MNKKLPVNLSPFIKTRYAYKKLKICRSCNHFTVLGDKQCMICGKKALISIDRKAASMLRRSMWKARLIAMFILLIGLVLSQSPMQLGLCAAGGIVLIAVLWIIQRKSAPAEQLMLLEKLFHKEASKLAAGLTADRDAAIAVFQSGNKPLTYEMLREVGALVQTDQLRLEQILLLQSFVLRKDMDLMLEPLLLDHFNPDLADYIGELSKIRRDLIKEDAFRYVLMYEGQILQMEHGESILIGVAGAAIRMKRYITLYPYLIIRYAHKLPKERFLRLYRMVQSSPHRNWEQLADEVERIYNEKYKWDEDFQTSHNPNN